MGSTSAMVMSSLVLAVTMSALLDREISGVRPVIGERMVV